jgi:hypothetical protein
MSCCAAAKNYTHKAAKNATQAQCGAPVRDVSAQYNATSTTLAVISGILVVFRIIYVVMYSPNGLGPDDYTVMLSLSFVIASAVINVKMLTENGLGKDIWTLTEDQITEFAKGFCKQASTIRSCLAVTQTRGNIRKIQYHGY